MANDAGSHRGEGRHEAPGRANDYNHPRDYKPKHEAKETTPLTDRPGK